MGFSRKFSPLGVQSTVSIQQALPSGSHKIAEQLVCAALFVVLACSSVVFLEPAPFDLLAVGLTLVCLAFGLRLPGLSAIPLLLLALFGATNILSMFTADSLLPDYDLVGFTRYVGITIYLFLTTILFLGVVYSYRSSALSAIWAGYTVAGIVAALAGIYGYFGMGPGAETLTLNDRAKGFFKDPNVLGPFLVPLILHHVLQLLNAKSLQQLVRVPIVALFLFALFVAFSRGAWANAILAFAVFVPLQFSAYRTTRARLKLGIIVFTAIAAVALSVAYLSTTAALADMIEKRANLTNDYDVGEGGRFDTQLDLIPPILAAPLGHGPNQLAPGTIQAPHNVYLKAFSEYGWLGGATWLAFNFVTVAFGFWASLQRTPLQSQTIIIFASVLAVTIQGLTIDTLHWRHYFLLLGMLWGLIALAWHRRGSRLEFPGQKHYAIP